MNYRIQQLSFGTLAVALSLAVANSAEAASLTKHIDFAGAGPDVPRYFMILGMA